LVVEADVLNIAGQNTKAHKWIQYWTTQLHLKKITMYDQI
jgi:hypothetical protein